jgi:hypothetical protein
MELLFEMLLLFFFLCNKKRLKPGTSQLQLKNLAARNNLFNMVEAEMRRERGVTEAKGE